MLRFLMIFGVVMVHTPPYMPLGQVPQEWSAQFVSFLQNAVFRGTVPLLTLISGYCLFRSGLDTDARQLITRKARTLLVPFLIFNLGFLLVDFLADRLFGFSLVFDPAAMNGQAWLDKMFAVADFPINTPLYFLRDLMVLMVLAPLFGWILRRAPIAGLMGIAIVFLTNIDGLLIFRDDMPVEFYLGGMLALSQANICKFDKYAYPALGVFIAACLYVVLVDERAMLVLRLGSPFLIWPVASVLLGTRFGQWLARHNRYSFFIFIAHAPLVTLLWKIDKQIGMPLPASIFPLLIPFLAAAFLIVVHKVAARVIPKPFALATGSRVKAKLREERRMALNGPEMWPAARERRMVR